MSRLRSMMVPAALFLLWVAAHFVGAGPRGSTVWIALARASAPLFHGDLERASQYVTTTVTLTAAGGAALRLLGSRRSRLLLRAGVLAVCLPLCVLLSISGALLFLLGVLAATLWTASARPRPAAQALDLALDECFALLSPLCFLFFSRQYNAQLLTQSLLVAAGLSLLARAARPASPSNEL